MEMHLEKGKVYWTNVVDHPDDFMVSSDGRLFSLRSNKDLKQHKNKAGYLTVASKLGGRKGRNICMRVHVMVAKAFVPNPDNKPFVNHIDGDKTNNEWWNLEWVTHKENMEHAFRTGLSKMIGKHVPPNKLTSEQHAFIKENTGKISSRKISRILGITRRTVKRYQNLPLPIQTHLERVSGSTAWNGS